MVLPVCSEVRRRSAWSTQTPSSVQSASMSRHASSMTTWASAGLFCIDAYGLLLNPATTVLNEPRLKFGLFGRGCTMKVRTGRGTPVDRETSSSTRSAICVGLIHAFLPARAMASA
eukprot:scaffold77778_cov69-Phaeocystis_antarctica.AAC.2